MSSSSFPTKTFETDRWTKGFSRQASGEVCRWPAIEFIRPSISRTILFFIFLFSISKVTYRLIFQLTNGVSQIYTKLGLLKIRQETLWYFLFSKIQKLYKIQSMQIT